MSEDTSQACGCVHCPNPACGCDGEAAAPRAAGECCCGKTCQCGADCACPPSCGCPATAAKAS